VAQNIAELGSVAGETGLASGQVLNSAPVFAIESAHLRTRRIHSFNPQR
jgi:hypothetical protein